MVADILFNGESRIPTALVVHKWCIWGKLLLRCGSMQEKQILVTCAKLFFFFNPGTLLCIHCMFITHLLISSCIPNLHSIVFCFFLMSSDLKHCCFLLNSHLVSIQNIFNKCRYCTIFKADVELQVKIFECTFFENMSKCIWRSKF